MSETTAMKKERSQAAVVGAKVLAAFEQGRTMANEAKKEQRARHVATIAILAQEDVQRGRGARGRAGRIARRMGGVLTERRIRQILSETLFSVSHSKVENCLNIIGGHAHAQR